MQCWISDGLVFANGQQDYNEGVNPLTLQWKDSTISFFPLVNRGAVKQGSKEQLINLRLEDNLQLTTVDE